MAGNRRALVIGATVLGILLLVVAVIYWVEPASSLPSFFPGHSSAGSAEANHHHTAAMMLSEMTRSTRGNPREFGCAFTQVHRSVD